MLDFPAPAVANLKRELAASGVAAGALVSAPTAERGFHLVRTALADVVLDPGPYSGHTTTGDALWMGAPLVSLGEPNSR